MISLIRKFTRGFVKGIFFSILLSSLTIISSIGLLSASAYLIVNAGFHPSIAFLQVSIVAVRFFGISRAVFRYLERLFSHSINLSILARIRETVFEKLTTTYPFHSVEYSSTTLLNLLTHDIDLLENLFVRFLLPIGSAIIVSICMGLFVGFQSIEIMLVMLFGFVLVGVLLPIISRLVGEKTSSGVLINRDDYQKTITEFLLTFQESILYRQADYLLNIQRIKEMRFAKSQTKQNVFQSLFASLSFFFVQMTAIAVVWVGFIKSSGLMNELIMLSIFYMMILASFESLQNLPAAANLYGGIHQGIKRIVEIQNSKNILTELCVPLKSPIFPLNFKEVSFSYPGANKAALRQINLELGQREKIAIVGQNGSGKSTFLSLVAGLLPNYQGKVTMNSQLQKEICRETILSKVGFFNNNPYIFSTSLRQNLLIANPLAKEESIQHIIVAVGLNERFENNQDEPILEHGRNISLGEKQRIEIARMLLREDELILLDEPLSAIDPLFRYDLIQLIRNHAKNKCLVWVTHQYFDMDYFDRILVFANGRIVEMGTHADLLAQDGVYFRLFSVWKGQFENS